MTKRMSLPAAGVVPAANVVAAEAAVVTAIAQPAAAAEAGAAAKAKGAAAPGMVGTDVDAAVEMVEPGIVEFVAPVGAGVQDTMSTEPTTTEQTQDPSTVDPATTTTTTTQTYDDGEQNLTPYIVSGGLLAGAIVALALTGGSDDDDNVTPPPPPPPPPPPANRAPTFTSGTTATVAENAATSTLVFDANATDPDNNTITYTIGGTDAAAFTINAQNGEVRLNQAANFEAKASYTFTVTATDNGTPAATATQTITVTVTDVNEAPTFATATATATVAENIAATTVVFDAAATDVDAGAAITYSLTGEDAAAFAIDAATGEVRFVASPDFETKAVYNVNVVATDNGNPGLTATQALTVNVTDVDEGPVRVDVDIDGGTIPATSQVDYDASQEDFRYIENAGEGNFSFISGFGQGDVILADVDSTEYSFTSLGDDIQIDLNNNGIVTRIVLVDAAVNDTFVEDEASAEAAAGFDFFLGAGDDPNPPVPPPPPPGTEVEVESAASFDASTGSFVFVDDVNEPNVGTRITGFGDDDEIVLRGGAEGQEAAFTSLGDDIEISFNNGGVVSQIFLVDAVEDTNIFVEDAASAERAVGFEFFSYA